MANKRQSRQWAWAPSPQCKLAVPDSVRDEVQAQADELIRDELRARYIKPPPKDYEWNYPIDLWTKWHKSFFYFGSTWASPGPNRSSPTFEVGFARLEYRPDGRFNLAYFRHTGKWWQIFEGLTLKECLKMVRDDGLFAVA
jgi:hypothetical protein